MAEIIEVGIPGDPNSVQIGKWIEEKQANEQKMLFRLNNLFREPIPTKKMRKIVLAAVEMMLHEVDTVSVWPAYKAIVAEENLAVWNKLPRPTQIVHWRLARMHQQLLLGDHAVPILDCNDFSELIRVIGAWLENGGGFGSPNINKAYRTGVHDGGSSSEYLDCLMLLKGKYGWRYDELMTPDERKQLNSLAEGGSYMDKQKFRDDQVWGKEVRQREDPNQHHAIEAHVADFWVKPDFDRQSGMQMFRANRNDLCKKIDLLFGFITGATISGTTTDTAFVLEAFGAQMKPPLHAGYYLFPVATIAASLHHSLLEAGLALTVAGAIDSYCAGFYTTLMPKGGLPAELEAARKILQEHEESDQNHHMVLWYNGNEKSPAGCIRWNKPYEKRDSRRLVEGKGLLTHVHTLPRVPDKRAVAHFIKLMAPRLMAYLPEALQAR